MVRETHVAGGDCMVSLTQVALRPFLRAWTRGVLLGLADAPQPIDDPRAHSSGADPDRILLFGTGAAVGWGVASHDLALPGSLARALSRITGRGTDVDALAGAGFMVAGAARRLGKTDLSRYDGIVLTFGLHEALRLESLAGWSGDLQKLLDYLTANAPRAALFVLGIHETTQIGRYDRMTRSIVGRHRAKINRESARICAHRYNATFIPVDLPTRTADNRTRTPAEYRQAAAILATRIAPVLDLGSSWQGNHPHRARTRTHDELEQQNQMRTSGVLSTQPEERFDHLTEFARRIFHTSSAAITVFDGPGFWTKSSIGPARAHGPREESICFTTMRHEDSLVISDASQDPRFAGTSALSGLTPPRFYAGHRVEAADGTPMGALCVYDPEPRDTSTFDRALLRDLALLVQKEVWAS